MKKILTLLLLISSFCGAQNYQCLQSGVKHYFINNTNYLRGIRIDSFYTIGDTTVYYPYKTFRSDPGSYLGGSWLGGKVLQSTNGIFLFDDAWGENITIKTQANPGESWQFYSNTASHTYMASVTSVDTMTILSVLDSIKKIVIKSYHSGIEDTFDPIDNFNIILSKNNGFVQVFDLYNFPYYSPSGAVCEDQYLNFLGIPGSVFYITDYHNPTSLEMYNLNVGDMFAGNYSNYSQCPGDYTVLFNHYDSVIYKSVIDSFHTNYAIHHIGLGTFTYYYTGGPPITTSSTEDYIDTLYADTSLIFLIHMPEEFSGPEYAYYYYPSDTTFCHLSPAYTFTFPWLFEGCPVQAQFKQGMLPTYDTTICALPDACNEAYIGYSDIITDVMYYASIDGISCGSLILPSLFLGVDNITPANALNIFPNPAQNELNITSSPKIQQVCIVNLLGQIQYNRKFNSEAVVVDVTNLSPGIYFVRVNNTETRKFVKQ